MIIEKIPGIQQLSAKEKVILAHELWREAIGGEFDFGDDPQLMEVLDERMRAYEDDPSSATPWEEVKERLRAEFGVGNAH